MRIPLLVAAALSTTSPAYAAGFFEDVTKSLNEAVRDTDRAIEKGTQDTGKAIEKGAQATGHTIEKKAFDANSFIQNLLKKTDDELLSLTLSIEPCSEVDCRGLPNEIARQAITLVRTQKQSEIDLEVRRSQARAAEVSAAMSCLSLIISICSFVRAGRRTPYIPTPAAVLPIEPQTQKS
jgi:hypothetical protein